MYFSGHSFLQGTAKLILLIHDERDISGAVLAPKLDQFISLHKLRWPDPQRHGINVSDVAKDIIQKLLMKDKGRRLGAKGGQEVLSHPFFDGIDLEKL